MAWKIFITVVVAFIPELFFSWIVGKLFEFSMWYIFLGLQICKFFLWIIRTIVGYLLFHLVWKNGLIDSTYCSLVQNQYPNPQKYLGSPISEYNKAFTYSGSDYFSDVMEDDEIEIKTRLDSAVTYGTVRGMTQTQGLLERMRTEKYLSRAVEKYHKVNFSGRDYQVTQM
jgi:hypothetical protein